MVKTSEPELPQISLVIPLVGSVIELQLLRDTSSATAGQLAALEAESQRRREALEAIGRELGAKSARLEEAEFEVAELSPFRDRVGALEARIEEADFELSSLRADLEKKDGELRQAQQERNRANEALVREREQNRKKKRRGLLG